MVNRGRANALIILGLAMVAAGIAFVPKVKSMQSEEDAFSARSGRYHYYYSASGSGPPPRPTPHVSRSYPRSYSVASLTFDSERWKKDPLSRPAMIADLFSRLERGVPPSHHRGTDSAQAEEMLGKPTRSSTSGNVQTWVYQAQKASLTLTFRGNHLKAAAWDEPTSHQMIQFGE